ncbi:MAG: tyrosine-type recombinase/integrase [Sphingomonadaceae bacterium]
MTAKRRVFMLKDDPGNYLAAVVAPFRNRLRDGQYSPRIIALYSACVFHFGEWLQSEGIDIPAISEHHTRLFLQRHIPTCSCSRHVRGYLHHNRSALNHLLRLMRDLEIIEAVKPDAIACEIRAFDDALRDVWGLAPSTRAQHRMSLRRLLKQASGSGVIDPSSISAGTIREFVLGKEARSLGTIRALSVFVRCYFRYRKLLGDDVTAQLAAVPRPTSVIERPLPEALTAEELDQLLASFDTSLPGQSRSYAIARCLADIGMRSIEVVRLNLDDIDWVQGEIRIAPGKGRRAERLPLPHATGQALVDYIRNERPATECRKVFVRHKSPVGLPVGRRVVQRVLHDAYKKLGWDRSRVHILRHTLATQLINAGTPVPQVADILRHRDIATTSIYARIDIDHLTQVAMPWPRSMR